MGSLREQFQGSTVQPETDKGKGIAAKKAMPEAQTESGQQYLKKMAEQGYFYEEISAFIRGAGT